MHFKKKIFITVLLFILFIGGTLSQAQHSINNNNDIQINVEIKHKKIINNGIDLVSEAKNLDCLDKDNIIRLVDWYNSHPLIEFANLIENTITIKFIDGSYTLLFNIFTFINKHTTGRIIKSYIPISIFSILPYKVPARKTSLILNPSEYLYGNHHCKKIINILLGKGYNIIYLANEDVDLTFIEQNLDTEIIYMNTHAGYWDIDGDSQPDAVVIATGEFWTNDTKDVYEFEYENQMIVEGMVGDNSFIAFTPFLIEHFYESGDLPDSLVYMATCHATFDNSMANAFLNSGASTYMGWTRNTVFWTNSLTSVAAFRLFSKGLNVKQICNFIRSGGLINLMIRSKLTYFGNGKHRLIK